ncbi:hypothetical protein BC941DRAFT_366025 [Chlamydoabsidia padenii]|nr:hypothetical protein BC941DRAFT_366025 [Chlamydoabsidia padenii]
MGNSTSTNQHSKLPALASQEQQKTDETRIQTQGEGQRQSQPTSIPNASTPFQFSITQPTTTTLHTPTSDCIPTTDTPNNMNSGYTSSLLATTTTPCATIPIATSSPKSVPGRAGWVSSTSSPWYGGGSISSSASSSHHHHQQQHKSHRHSVNGPYYRARGMSINQQQEPTEDDFAPTYQQHLSPSVSSSISSSPASQPPNLQFQQMRLDSTPLQQDTQSAPTVITWSQGGNNVYVTGTFNGWKHKVKLVKSTHDFNTVLDLPHGTHRLKFIVDDEWRCSNEMETATDPDGNLVNYLQVMEESDMYNDDDDDNDGTPKGDDTYTTTIPNELLLLSEQDEKQQQEWERNLSAPILPPHLETVLLNAKDVSHEDNSVLPVPNHVTLNHLYACSIKDHVMALSTTTRYRKKYVTTMYYKPVQSHLE